MNKTVTSKDEILAASRTLLLEGGASALNMRAVAAACGIAVGSLYNYFPSKGALIGATIERIWTDIFRGFMTAPVFEDFAACTEALLTALDEGEAQYPGFFTVHALSFATSDKADGRALMARGFATLRAKLVQSLEADANIRNGVFDGALSRDAYADYVLKLAIMQELHGNSSTRGALLALVRNSIY